MQIRDQFRAVAAPALDTLDAPAPQAPPAWRTSLIGGATGGMAGAALGDSIDENLQLAQYRCQQCGHCSPTK